MKLSLKKRAVSTEAVHLNITPFIDILVCLLLFLLSSAAFLKLAVIDTNLPKLNTSAVSNEPEKDKFVVTVTVRSSGFEIGRRGADTQPGRWQKGGDLARRFPLLKSGEYDYLALNRHMVRLKDVYPAATSVLILPEGNVRFETLVATMDATRETVREDGKIRGPLQPLFPDAVLGQLSEEAVRGS